MAPCGYDYDSFWLRSYSCFDGDNSCKKYCKFCNEYHYKEYFDIVGRCKNQRNELYKNFSILYWTRKLERN